MALIVWHASPFGDIMKTVGCSLTACVAVPLCFCCRILNEEGHATVPKLAEKLTLELVHHIQVNTFY